MTSQPNHRVATHRMQIRQTPTQQAAWSKPNNGFARAARGRPRSQSHRVGRSRLLRAIAVSSALLVWGDAATAQDDAYLDRGARLLVEQARQRRNSVDRSIVRYQTTVQERISAGIRAVGRERLLYRRETAGRIDWRREGAIDIEVLGAREVIPALLPRPQIPDDLDGFMPHLAFDPMESEMLVRMDTTSIRHPLVAGSEAHYRFRSGDTTTIRLPDGRDVRLIELVVIPRRDEFQLMTGSFWIDAATHAVVRVVFRPARPFDLERDADEDDDDDVPGVLKPIRAELLYITLEYGLWDLRWWLPRLMAAEGALQISFLTMPVQYERRYSAYEIEADTTLPPLPADSVLARPCRAPTRMRVRVGDDRRTDARTEVRPNARRQRMRSTRDTVTDPDQAVVEEEECSQWYEVTVPDSAALMTSAYLPADVYSDEAELITISELESIGDRLGKLPEAPWQLSAPSFRWGLGVPLRYNRIEALSIGAATVLDLGRMQAELSGRLGTADLEPNGELKLMRETPGVRMHAGAYRRLAAANPDTKPLGTGHSLSAFLFGRDDGEYFRTGGGELQIRPGLAQAQWYELRLFGERQWRADVETDFSLRHLLDDEHVFRPNLRAMDADQFGAELTLRASNGLDPVGFRWGAELAFAGQTGTFDFARPGLTLRAASPMPFGLLAGLELAGGTATGDVPPQSNWFLGGPATLRGYPGGAVRGDAFWRSRLELSTQLPAARIVLFSDAGWAGARSAFQRGRALVSAGAGGSFLDGLIRIDLARALRPPTGWRLDFYISGAL